MRLTEIDNVAQFPQKGIDSSVTGIDVPKGFDSFYVKDENKRIASIYGVRPDGKHSKISTTTKELANILAKAYNNGGKSNVAIQKVSMVDAFGSEVEKAFDNLDIKFAEKPESWNYIKNNYSCSMAQVKKALSIVGNIPTMTASEIFVDGYGKYPMSDIQDIHPETCMIKMSNGDTFIADKGGSRSYYRMWVYIRPTGLSVVK